MIIGLVLSSTPNYSETFFRNKIRYLTEEGFKVKVFTADPNDIKSDYEIVKGFSWHGNWIIKSKNIALAVFDLLISSRKATALYSLNKKSGYPSRKNILSLLSSAHILKYKLDWLHFGFATTALGKENLAKVVGAKMAVSIRGFDIAIYPLKHADCYNLLWRHLDKLHYISDDLLDLALNQGFELQTEHQKITPAINTSLFSGKEKKTFSNPPKIVTVARLNWKKGLEYTLEALSLLAKKGIDFEYTIIGEGEEYERLMFACHQLGIKEKVCFAGKKNQAEIKKTLLESDIYLQYSIQEGFCNAALEAQAMGLLCIVSDAEGLSENVIHNETGWVVAKRNPVSLADRIIAVLDLSETERIHISQSAMTRIKKLFNLEKQKLSFLEFYK